MTELELSCYEFFYWFSRFEYSLKNNDYLRCGRHGEAMADWDKFIRCNTEYFSPNANALTLIEAKIRQQICNGGSLIWKDVDLSREETQLGKAVLTIKTIRNNLFHGGKGDKHDWDKPERNVFLLTHGKLALDDLALLGGFGSDYTRIY